jgi:predicted deacylase
VNLKSTFTWLPVATMPDGSELCLRLHVIKGVYPGPTVGLSGAIHGDEVTSPVSIIRRVLELVNPKELSGTIMAVPVCNPLGAGQMSRNTPGDGQNANAVFFEPGQIKYTGPVKTVTEQIAEVLTGEFLAQLDYQIDFHDGAGHHSVHMVEYTKDPVSSGMARAFCMPILLFDEWRRGQMWRRSERLGAKVIVASCGGQGQLYNEWVDRGVHGVFNVMRYLGMLPGEVEPPPRQLMVRGDSGHEHNTHRQTVRGWSYRSRSGHYTPDGL